MKYEIYKGQKINGYDGKEFMKHNPHLTGTVYLFYNNGCVSRVESKDILSKVFNIDKNLSDNEFITEYERILNDKKSKLKK